MKIEELNKLKIPVIKINKKLGEFKGKIFFLRKKVNTPLVRVNKKLEEFDRRTRFPKEKTKTQVVETNKKPIEKLLHESETEIFGVKINKKLEEFRGKILFPKKLALANKMLENVKLPKIEISK